MISCPTCGVVLDEEKAKTRTEMFGKKIQVSIYCPVCDKLAARTIDGEEVKVNEARPAPEAPKAEVVED